MTAGNRLRCQTCKKQFTRPLRSNRLNCYECRPERTGSNVTPLRAGDGDQDQQDDGPLTRLSTKTLEDAGVLDTWQGAAVIALAKLIDTGKHGASGAAGTIKAHREAMAVALADSEEDADIITAIFAEGS